MLPKDYQDMLFALSEQQVDFIIVGAYALAAHGLVRATGDIDIWIRPSPDNALKTFQALKTFGAPMMGLTKEDLTTPGTIFQIGIAPLRIDLLTSISGVDDFDQAFQNSKKININNISISVLDRKNLIDNKRASARPKDLADVAWLESQPNEKS
jgi:hypothetical protein